MSESRSLLFQKKDKADSEDDNQVYLPLAELSKDLVFLIAGYLPGSDHMSLARVKNHRLRTLMREIAVCVQGNPENKKTMGVVMDFLTEISDINKIIPKSKLTMRELSMVVAKRTLEGAKSRESREYIFVATFCSVIGTLMMAIPLTLLTLLNIASDTKRVAGWKEMFAILFCFYLACQIGIPSLMSIPHVPQYKAFISKSITSSEHIKLYELIEERCEQFFGHAPATNLSNEQNGFYYAANSKKVTRRLCRDIFSTPHQEREGGSEPAPAAAYRR